MCGVTQLEHRGLLRKGARSMLASRSGGGSCNGASAVPGGTTGNELFQRWHIETAVGAQRECVWLGNEGQLLYGVLRGPVECCGVVVACM